MIHLISGSDWFRAKQYIDELIKDYEAKQCHIVRVSTNDEGWFETVLQYAKQDSLFSEQNCVVLSIEAQKKDDSKDQSEEELRSTKDKKQNLQAIIKAFAHANQPLVMWNRGRKMALAAKGAKSRTVPQRGSGTGIKIQDKEFNPLQGDKLVLWIQEYAKTCGASISSSCSQDVALACESDTAIIAHEIQKCALCYPDEKITKQHIQELCSYAPAMTYFDWMQDIFSGNWKTKALTAGLDEHDAAQRLAGLINALRIILVSRSQPSAERTGFMKNVNPYWLRSLKQWSTDVSGQTLERWFAVLAQYDMWVRSGKISEPEALERFVFSY